MRYDLHLLWQCWIHYIFKTFLHRFKSIYLNKSNGYTEETFFFGSVLENYSERKTSAVRRALKIDHTHSKSKSAKEWYHSKSKSAKEWYVIKRIHWFIRFNSFLLHYCEGVTNCFFLNKWYPDSNNKWLVYWIT